MTTEQLTFFDQGELKESSKEARARRAMEKMAAEEEKENEEKRKKRFEEKKNTTGVSRPEPKPVPPSRIED